MHNKEPEGAPTSILTVQTIQLMRFRLQLQVLDQGQPALPFNYQYPLSAWIYKTLAGGDQQYATWLHEHGYGHQQHFYKHFTFSQLQLGKIRPQGDRMLLQQRQGHLFLSFWAPEGIAAFVQGLFRQQEFRLGDRKSQVGFQVEQVERLPEPPVLEGPADGWLEAEFRALSPLCVSVPEERGGKLMPTYLSPDDPRFVPALVQTLARKAASIGLGADFDAQEVRMQVLGKPRPRLVTIKADTPQETKVKGWQFPFRLHAPRWMLQVGYASGFGEKGSLGFGMGEVSDAVKQ